MSYVLIDNKSFDIEIVSKNAFEEKLSLLLSLCTDLTHNERDVLRFIVSHADNNFYTGTYEDILKVVPLSRAPVSQAIVSLQKKEYLERTKIGWRFSENFIKLKENKAFSVKFEEEGGIKFFTLGDFSGQVKSFLETWLKISPNYEEYKKHKKQALATFFAQTHGFRCRNVVNAKTNKFQTIDLDFLLKSDSYAMIFCFEDYEAYKNAHPADFIKFSEALEVFRGLNFEVIDANSLVSFERDFLNSLKEGQIIIIKDIRKESNLKIDTDFNTYVFNKGVN